MWTQSVQVSWFILLKFNPNNCVKGVRAVNVCLSRNCAMGTLIATTERTRSSAAMLKLNFNVLSLVSIVNFLPSLMVSQRYKYDEQASALPVQSCATVSTTVVTQATSCWLPAVLSKELVAALAQPAAQTTSHRGWEARTTRPGPPQPPCTSSASSSASSPSSFSVSS